MKNFLKNIEWRSIIITATIVLVVVMLTGGYILYGSLSSHRVSVITQGKGTCEGEGLYRAGEVVILTAIPDEGYEFLGWFNGDSEDLSNPISDSLTYSFIIQIGDVKFKAVFMPID